MDDARFTVLHEGIDGEGDVAHAEDSGVGCLELEVTDEAVIEEAWDGAGCAGFSALEAFCVLDAADAGGATDAGVGEAEAKAAIGESSCPIDAEVFAGVFGGFKEFDFDGDEGLLAVHVGEIHCYAAVLFFGSDDEDGIGLRDVAYGGFDVTSGSLGGEWKLERDLA